MSKKIIIAGALVLAGIVLIAKKAFGSECFPVFPAGTGADAPYYYARWKGASTVLSDALGAAKFDVFTVEYQEGGIWVTVPEWSVVEHNQLIRFQVIRQTNICGFKQESEP